MHMVRIYKFTVSNENINNDKSMNQPLLQKIKKLYIVCYRFCMQLYFNLL